MSVAGIRSNRGDSYQTLVAFHWALSVLVDSDYVWLEVDSVASLVDDIVIGRADGTTICCQCKKNQPDFSAWSISDLSDELKKAREQLVIDSSAEVRFYSRGSFGMVAKLREHCKTQPTEARYQASLSKALLKVDAQLARCLDRAISTYEFLQRISFEVSPEIDQMSGLLRERLRYLVSSPAIAYDALWRCLDQFGARFETTGLSSTQHRLSKEDLQSILHRAGAVLAPIMVLSDIRKSFASTSAIGRAWRRDIGGSRIPTAVVPNLLAAIFSRKRSILLTGLPGSGKTCAILEVQEKLEQIAKTSTDLIPLFIQSREFVDLTSTQDRQEQGLPKQWVEKVARLAETAHVVIVIDSLDVLSIAREHNVLTYFLAQIDRLLMIQNVTVVTACRNFDRHYDRRIAERQEQELKCEALNWDADIEPLLNSLSIDPTIPDALTKELIRNPRELALYVELAQRHGSFNVVTSQALAQQYLGIVVQANGNLGDAAMIAVESIADEMLMSRSLAVPRQRFTESQDILRLLLSHNVLHETQEGNLTFGHQTLLDVLVISSALRRQITLAQFIEELPPVPFVRPSIRSFVAQLTTGDRGKFRKQLRAVLMGSSAFHIRRLVAESFAEQEPQDDDWPLLRDLRNNFREVFQVIYLQAGTLAWHYFWMKYLVPTLADARDLDGIAAHAHRVAQWKNDDPKSVLAYWCDLLEFDWIDHATFSTQIGHHLSDFELRNAVALAPLLKKMLEFPLQEHSSLGRAISRCISVGGVGDELLWRYVVSAINDDDICGYQLSSKLRCQPHEFGDRGENFLLQRMISCSLLLDLAIESIEHWSLARISRQGIWMAGSTGFLHTSSYNDAHSQENLRHVDGDRILMDAIEAAVRAHARTQSDWWQLNRERLCFSHEGVLRYFAICAFATSPEANIELIGRLACDKDSLESELSYEMGSLLEAAFIYLAPPAQEAALAILLRLHDEKITNDQSSNWVFRARAEVIAAVPCYLRSPAAQHMLNAYESIEGAMIRQPDIRQRGGFVGAPFSFEVFLTISDTGVLKLLTHYAGYSSWQSFDFLSGGEREVGVQLTEATSRDPLRFVLLLQKYWSEIAPRFREDIIEGTANYLAYRYGNLQPNSNWQPTSEPNASMLAQEVLAEFERHPVHWRHNRAASKGLQACAHVVKDVLGMARIVFLALGFADLREVSSISGGERDPISIGINMLRGHVVDALMILATHCSENGIEYPELLAPALHRFARDEQAAIRALILRRLPYLQSIAPDLGWDLFEIALDGDASILWETAEPCLYYSYRDHFARIQPYLARLRNHETGKGLETWGRISALSAFSKCIDFSVWIEDLKKLNAVDAWRGAASVWTHRENIRQHREQCHAGIVVGLSGSITNAAVIARQVGRLFDGSGQAISIPTSMIQRCFSIFETDMENKNHDFFAFGAWLNATAHRDPDQALASATTYLAYVGRTKAYLYDHEDNLTQLLTRLFAEAEEREGEDQGQMLKQVVGLQDTMLSLGVNGVKEWLGAAERP